MTDRHVDPDLALAELALDRLDGTRPTPADDGDDGPYATGDDGVVVALDPSDGIRIDGEGDDADSRDPYTDTHALDEVSDAVDAFDEAFNARDLDGVLDVLAEDVEAPGLGNDRDNLPDALEELWERCPNCLLTRGWLDGRCVSVMWEPGELEGWWRIAIVHFDDVEAGRIGMLELTDDQVVLDQVETDGPDGDAEEGTRWEEWAEGDGD